VKSQAAHFDDVAAGYDESVPAHLARHLTARRVALAESLVPRGSVLDVGCGTGRFLAALPDRYERVGLDLSPEMLVRARNRGLDVVQGSSEKVPFADDSFDLVTTFAVLHHLIDHELVRATLRELARVARPGGAVIVWDHNPRNLYWPILMSRLPQDQGNEALVPAQQIVDTLHAAGARGVSLRRMTFVPDFTPPWALPVMSHVERLLERLPLVNLMAAHNVVIARL
jgi:ubiquinone/menaquinone biosynthesis C-methylase UbiE